MIFSEFINKVNKYLKSVRILKNYISFDMIFPETWTTIKKFPEGIEIIQNENNDGKIITSFVCENKNTLIDTLEKSMDTFIKSNIEREEKEKLFKSKVQELKNIFEKEKLENLKGLKFDVEELTKLLENDEKETNGGVVETA
jgi:predicted DNA binding protein